jgi:SRSO17 transposase
LADFGKW